MSQKQVIKTYQRNQVSRESNSTKIVDTSNQRGGKYLALVGQVKSITGSKDMWSKSIAII